MDNSGKLSFLLSVCLCSLYIWDTGVDGYSFCSSFDNNEIISCPLNTVTELDNVKYYQRNNCRGKSKQVTSCDDDGDYTTIEYLENECNDLEECHIWVDRCRDYNGRSVKIFFTCKDLPTTVPTTTEIKTTSTVTTRKSVSKTTTTGIYTSTLKGNSTSNSTLTGEGVDAAPLSDGSSDTGAIAGGIIGGVIILVIAAVIVFIIRRRKSKEDQKKVLGNRENRASLTASCDENYYDTPEPVVGRPASNAQLNGGRRPDNLPISSEQPPLYSLEHGNWEAPDNPVYMNSPSTNKSDKFSNGTNSPDRRQDVSVSDDATYAPVYAEPDGNTTRGDNLRASTAVPGTASGMQPDASPNKDSPDANYYSVATLVEPPEYSLSKPVPMEHVAGSKYLVFEREHENEALQTDACDDRRSPCPDEFGYSHLDDMQSHHPRPSNYDDLILPDAKDGGYVNLKK